MEGFDASGVLTVEEPLAKRWDAFTRLEQCRNEIKPGSQIDSSLLE